MASTLFHRVGGFASVRKVVSAFYDKTLESELVRGYFENLDMRVLIDHQTKFIASLMGGPAAYTDDALQRVHAHLNISRQEFAEIAMLLRETLEDHDFEQADVDHVHKEFTRREPLIVSRMDEEPRRANVGQR